MTEQPPTPVRAGNYKMAGDRIILIKETRDQAGNVTKSEEIPLTNFAALITGDVRLDDGAEVRSVFEVTARLNGRSARFTVPADRFRSMNWADEHLGAGAIVRPGMGLRDHAAVAVKELSAAAEGGIPARHVYAHTGWRQLPGGYGYLTASGAMMAGGLDDDVTVELTGSISRYELPDPQDPATVREAIRWSLAILELAADSVTVPLLGAAYRAPLPMLPNCTPWLRGQSGALKTALCTLTQQHFGAGMDAEHLPGSWASTANRLETDAHAIANAVLVVDDYRPDLSAFDARRRADVADRLIRGSANQSFRGRLRSDTSRRPDRPPRAQLLCSAKDLPPGTASLRARTMISQLPKDSVDTARLTDMQKAAEAGTLALAMAGYVRRLAGGHEMLRDNLGPRLADLRVAARKAGHLRTPENVASLYLGWEQFLAFAQAAGAISDGERQALAARVWKALRELGDAQARYLAEGDHVAAFLGAIRAMITAEDGRLTMIGAGEDLNRYGWQGKVLGWARGDDVYLHPEVSYAEARKWAEREGAPLGVSKYQLQDDMKERGLLASHDEGRTTVRIPIGGKRPRVLHLTAYQFENYGQ
jgi:hypothetical protein